MTEKCPTPGESWGTFNFGKKKGRQQQTKRIGRRRPYSVVLMLGVCQRNLSSGTVKSASNLSWILWGFETFLVHSASGAKLQNNAPTRADGLPTSSTYGLPDSFIASDTASLRVAALPEAFRCFRRVRAYLRGCHDFLPGYNARHYANTRWIPRQVSHG